MVLSELYVYGITFVYLPIIVRISFDYRVNENVNGTVILYFKKERKPQLSHKLTRKESMPLYGETNSNNMGTVLVLVKLTKLAVALRLRCGSCKLVF